MLSFKQTFSLSPFTFIKRLFCSSLLFAISDHIDKYPSLWEKYSYDDPSGFELLPGDVIFQKWSTNGRSYGHIMIYIGDGKVANAHYGSGGRYGIIQLLRKQVRYDTEIRTVKKSYVFRPVR